MAVPSGYLAPRYRRGHLLRDRLDGLGGRSALELICSKSYSSSLLCAGLRASFRRLASEAEIAAALSYVVAPENVTIVSYSEWIRKELFDRHGAPSLKVSCHPRGWKQQKRAGSIVGLVGSANTGYRSSVSAFVSEKGDEDSVLTIVAMIRPHSRQRCKELRGCCFAC